MYQIEKNVYIDRLTDLYLSVREYIIQAGFAQEIDWQDSRSLTQLTENQFLAESAWVILSAGMREIVVRERYQGVSEAFVDWISSDVISAQRSACEEEALKVFNHLPKIQAIGSLCQKVSECGFQQILHRIEAEGVAFLQTFHFIGPVTSFHLAKNIGLDVVKPDRHLTRMAAAADLSPEELCKDIAAMTGDKLSTIDLVLWRYATLDLDYLCRFQEITTSYDHASAANHFGRPVRSARIR